MVSRQMIAATVSAVAGLLMFFGIDIDQAAIGDAAGQVIGGVVFLYGVALAVFRKITSSPLLGWFTKAKT